MTLRDDMCRETCFLKQGESSNSIFAPMSELSAIKETLFKVYMYHWYNYSRSAS